MKQPKNVLVWMTSEHAAGLYCQVQLRTMAKVGADFLHKNKTAEITVYVPFNMFILAFFLTVYSRS
jgi:hypothetical protein